RAAWADAIAACARRSRSRADIAELVGAQQRRREAPAAAVEAARKLADPRAVVIITGQQAGLFGGPLYTLLKPWTALKLADRVSHEHGVPVVRMFWIEAEDHDGDEVRSCSVLDSELVPRSVALPARSGSEPVPIARIPLDEAVLETLAGL